MKKHEFVMPQYVIDRVMAKRGKLRVFDRFEPAKTAVLVVDMQNFYVAEVETAKAIVPTINCLSAHMRRIGGTVAWVNMTAGEAGKSLWPIYHDYFFTPQKGAAHRDSLSEGADGHKLYPGLETAPGDVFAYKSRFSAFIQGASDLDRKLRARGIENLVICGTATNFCCETTARDAMMVGYRVVMVADANAARYDEDHIVGLTTVFQSFGDVLTAEQVMGELLATPAASVAAQ